MFRTGRIATILRQEDIDYKALVIMNEADLTSINIRKGPRVKLLRGIKLMQDAETIPSVVGTSYRTLSVCFTIITQAVLVMTWRRRSPPQRSLVRQRSQAQRRLPPHQQETSHRPRSLSFRVCIM